MWYPIAWLQKPFSSLLRIVAGTDLRARLTKGSFWLSAGAACEHLFRLVRNIVLAKLLLLQDFGVVGIVLASVALLESFSEVGVQQAVIQNKSGNEPTFLNAAWWFAVSRAASICVFGYFIAPCVSAFYSNP